MHFIEVARLGYGHELVPIIPPDAKISEKSKAIRAVEKGRGKLPGKRLQDGWVGFSGWESYKATPADYQAWAGWGAGMGLRTAHFPAFDVDVLDKTFSDAIQIYLQGKLGGAPCRVGRAPKALLLCRALDTLTKRKLAFTLPGSDVVHAVELLGAGQQFVLQGVHPATGKPYTWPKPLKSANELPELTVGLAEEIFGELAELVEMLGGTITKKSSAADKTQAAAGDAAPDAESVRAALACIPNDVDYDEWVQMGAAIKGALGEDGRDIWLDWSAQYGGNDPDECAEKWASFKPPFRLGWTYIAERAQAHGFDTTQYDFEAEEETPETVIGALVRDNIWVEKTKQAFEIKSRTLRDREQFNVRNRHIGKPSSATGSAWAQWTSEPDLQCADGLTYRPGGPLIVEEPSGKCVNLWTPSKLKPRVGDASPWLNHLAYLVPDDEQREVFLSWLAFLLQYPGVKPQWAVVLGGAGGVGKDLALQPIIAALGRHNVQTVSPEQMAGSFNDWYGTSQLIIVEEMMNFERTDQSNRLKKYLSGLPEFVPINKKFQAPFDVPNTGAFLFFTNFPDALSVAKDDRRYHVLWADAAPKDADYYRGLVEWYAEGGYAFVTNWLLERDISAFKDMVRPPMTEAKALMHRATLPAAEAWVADGVEAESGVFALDLVTTEDVIQEARHAVGARSLSATKMGIYLRNVGAVALGQHWLSDGQRVRLYSLRRHEMYASLSSADRARQYEKSRQGKGTEALFANAT